MISAESGAITPLSRERPVVLARTSLVGIKKNRPL
jgi:hypothetical protein